MVRVRTAAELGALAHAARTGRGWSQQQAADAAGVSRRFVSMLEGGGHTNAELWRVLALLDALEVELVATLPVGSTTDGTGTATAPATETAAPDGFDLDAHLSTFRNERDSS